MCSSALREIFAITKVFTLTLRNISLTTSTLKMVASLYLREVMQPDFVMLTESVEIFYSLLKFIDLEAFEFFTEADVEPTIVLTRLITWFSNEINNISVMSSLVDAFLATHPLFPM